MLKLPAITIPQPWASLYVRGVLAWHVRDWCPTSCGVSRGLLAIHSGLSEDGRREYERHAGLLADHYRSWADLPRGMVVGVATLVGYWLCEWLERPLYSHLAGARRPLDRELCDFRAGRWAWLLMTPRALKAPVAARGRPRIWVWWAPPGVLADLTQPPLFCEAK